jgi:NAD(P) transhydrogenase subunit beta
MEDLQLLINAVYLLSAVAFLLGLKLMSQPASAQRGAFIAAIGLLSAVVVTLMDLRIERFEYALGGLALGALAGMQIVRRAEKGGHLQTLALLNGFVALACLLVAWSEFLAHAAGQGIAGGTALSLTVVFGGVAFASSMTAWARLGKKINLSSPLTFGSQRFLAQGLAMSTLIFAIVFSKDTVAPEAGRWLALATLLASLLGAYRLLSLHSLDIMAGIALSVAYTGLSVCMAGFVFQNVLLVATGALVAGSGLAIALAICKAMNRPAKVLAGGFFPEDSKPPAPQ